MRDQEVARTGPALVADASVIAKWFVKEDFSDESNRIRDAHVRLETRTVVPTLAKYEVLNALKHSGKSGTQEIAEASKDLDGYQLLEVSPDSPLWERTVRMAMEMGLTVYDAAYLAVDEANKIRVCTADARILDKAEGPGAVRHIRTLV